MFFFSFLSFQRMFTARAARIAMTVNERTPSIIIRTFAVFVSGIVSVGLKAVAVVKATKK
jgi:hypothetical protein